MVQAIQEAATAQSELVVGRIESATGTILAKLHRVAARLEHVDAESGAVEETLERRIGQERPISVRAMRQGAGAGESK